MAHRDDEVVEWLFLSVVVGVSAGFAMDPAHGTGVPGPRERVPGPRGACAGADRGGGKGEREGGVRGEGRGEGRGYGGEKYNYPFFPDILSVFFG